MGRNLLTLLLGDMWEHTPGATRIFNWLRRRRFSGIATVFVSFWAVMAVPIFLLVAAISSILPTALSPHVSEVAFWTSGVFAAVAVWVLYGRIPPSE